MLSDSKLPGCGYTTHSSLQLLGTTQERIQSHLPAREGSLHLLFPVLMLIHKPLQTTYTHFRLDISYPKNSKSLNKHY